MDKSEEVEEFLKAYNDKKDLYVFVYMTGCPYCEPIHPIWEQLEKDLKKEDVKLAKLEKDNASQIKEIGLIDSYPTFLFIDKEHKKRKEEPDRDYESLKKWVLSPRKHKKHSKGGSKKKKSKRKTRKTRKSRKSRK